MEPFESITLYLLTVSCQIHSYLVQRCDPMRCLLALFEARAILLGRLKRHEPALEIYVYRLHDYDAAEEFAPFPNIAHFL